MGIPVCLTAILIIIFFGTIFSENASSRNRKKIKDFLDEESKVYILPKEKLESIDFINIDFSKYKFKPKSNETKKELKNLLSFQNRKICNFDNISNNELKKIYGTNNFEEVLSYQNNYDDLLKKLIFVSELLITDKDDKGAIYLLEKSIDLNSDLTKNYTLLADLYIKNSMRKELFKLIDIIKCNNNLSQNNILNYISKIQKADKKEMTP